MAMQVRRRCNLHHLTLEITFPFLASCPSTPRTVIPAVVSKFGLGILWLPRQRLRQGQKRPEKLSHREAVRKPVFLDRRRKAFDTCAVRFPHIRRFDRLFHLSLIELAASAQVCASYPGASQRN